MVEQDRRKDENRESWQRKNKKFASPMQNKELESWEYFWKKPSISKYTSTTMECY